MTLVDVLDFTLQHVKLGQALRERERDQVQGLSGMHNSKLVDDLIKREGRGGGPERVLTAIAVIQPNP